MFQVIKKTYKTKIFYTIGILNNGPLINLVDIHFLEKYHKTLDIKKYFNGEYMDEKGVVKFNIKKEAEDFKNNILVPMIVMEKLCGKDAVL